jgi:hypothetical protein
MLADQFVPLQMDLAGVPILGVLNQKDHQERHNRSTGVNDQLPAIGVTK